MIVPILKLTDNLVIGTWANAMQPKTLWLGRLFWQDGTPTIKWEPMIVEVKE